MSNDTPQRLGDYEILKVLGAGGMGRVYQVRNVITDRIEAMKVLLPEIGGQEEVAARFLREIKVLAALNHPHIARLHTALTIDNQLVMIMEFVAGPADLAPVWPADRFPCPTRSPTLTRCWMRSATRISSTSSIATSSRPT